MRDNVFLLTGILLHGRPPAWLEIVVPKQPPDAELIETDLDPGERDAILLAQELSADELIIDDRNGRREAQRRRLHFIGTVGVLQTAAGMGLLDFREALTRLRVRISTSRGKCSTG